MFSSTKLPLERCKANHVITTQTENRSTTFLSPFQSPPYTPERNPTIQKESPDLEAASSNKQSNQGTPKHLAFVWAYRSNGVQSQRFSFSGSRSVQRRISPPSLADDHMGNEDNEVTAKQRENIDNNNWWRKARGWIQ